MKTTNKILLILSIVALCVTLALDAQAAKKLPPKTTKKTIHIIKKIPATKKQITAIIKKPTVPPSNIIPPTKSTSATSSTASAYPWHDNILATQFYIGETGLSGTTAWDCHAVNHYGGIDSPFGRDGYNPKFTPKENPFYLALPYTDIGEDGTHKKNIPWYDAKLDKGDNYSFVKNRWVEMKRDDKICYGQWEDSLTPDILDPTTGKRIGYGKPNHFDYVFGSASTTHPGIDISPALSDCLGMRDPNDKQFGHTDAPVSWKFVSDGDVPSGAWKNFITVTPVSWNNCQ